MFNEFSRFPFQVTLVDFKENGARGKEQKFMNTLKKDKSRYSRKKA